MQQAIYACVHKTGGEFSKVVCLQVSPELSSKTTPSPYDSRIASRVLVGRLREGAPRYPPAPATWGRSSAIMTALDVVPDEERGVSQEHVEQEALVGIGNALEIEGVRRVRSPEAPKMTIVEGWESVRTFHRSSSYLGAAERALSQARTRAAR